MSTPSLKDQLITTLTEECGQRLTAINHASGRLAASEALAEHLTEAGLTCKPGAASYSTTNGGAVSTWASVTGADINETLLALRRAGLVIDDARQVTGHFNNEIELHLNDIDVPLFVRGTLNELRAAAMVLDMIVRVANDTTEAPATLQRQAA